MKIRNTSTIAALALGSLLGAAQASAAIRGSFKPASTKPGPGGVSSAATGTSSSARMPAPLAASLLIAPTPSPMTSPGPLSARPRGLMAAPQRKLLPERLHADRNQAAEIAASLATPNIRDGGARAAGESLEALLTGAERKTLSSDVWLSAPARDHSPRSSLAPAARSERKAAKVEPAARASSRFRPDSSLRLRHRLYTFVAGGALTAAAAALFGALGIIGTAAAAALALTIMRPWESSASSDDATPSPGAFKAAEAAEKHAAALTARMGLERSAAPSIVVSDRYGANTATAEGRLGKPGARIWADGKLLRKPLSVLGPILARELGRLYFGDGRPGFLRRAAQAFGMPSPVYFIVATMAIGASFAAAMIPFPQSLAPILMSGVAAGFVAKLALAAVALAAGRIALSAVTARARLAEFRADSFAAWLVGPKALIRALKSLRAESEREEAHYRKSNQNRSGWVPEGFEGVFDPSNAPPQDHPTVESRLSRLDDQTRHAKTT